MVETTRVRNLLQMHLFSMATDMVIDAVEIAVENEEYTPKSGIPYQAIHLMPTDVEDMSLQFDGVTKASFLFQITLRYPTKSSTNDIETRTVKTMSRFERGTHLTDDITDLRIIQSPVPRVLANDGDRYSTAISIYLYATEI